MYRLYRDDDISVTSDINLLKKVHEYFIKYNKIHTVAVLMKDIWDNKEIWYWLMTAKNLSIGLHGWKHKNYSELSAPKIACDIHKSLQYWRLHVTRGNYNAELNHVFYPPWNAVGQELISACKDAGFAVDSRVGGEVFNFHYWACQDQAHMSALEEALK